MRRLVAALGLLIHYRALLGIGGLAALILYGIYTLVLRSGVLSPLTPQASFGVLSEIIEYTFIFAVTAVSLSVVAYALPRILPSSVFGSVPKIEYSLAIAEMFDPFAVNPLAKMLDKIELFPGFPYYSRESDHPSAWPLRASHDREVLQQAYRNVLKQYDLARLAGDIGSGIQVTGLKKREEKTEIESLANLRNWYYSKLGGDPERLVKVVGKEAGEAFAKVEQERSDLRDSYPNRFAVLRIKNTGRVDAQDIILELDIHGELYDYAVSADETNTKGAEYDRAGRRIYIGKMLPGYLVEIRFWYNYLAVDKRMFPDKKDVILDVTQGIVINNIVVSGGQAIYSRSLVADLDAYGLKYLGSATKADFDKDLGVYQKRQVEPNRKQAKKQEHPSLKSVAPDVLATTERPDASVNAIWVSFDSAVQKSYTAVHVFKHPNGPYILLSSKDKDREDFIKVRSQLEGAYNGKAEEEISDRGDDIASVIRVASGFTQKDIAARVKNWFQPTFTNAVIEAVHY